MCKKCKGKDPKCICRGKITTMKGDAKRGKDGKIINQKGAFGS